MVASRVGLGLLSILLLTSSLRAGDDTSRALAEKARKVLQTHCYRCHGQDGTNEGGLNFVTDLKQLVQRRRVTPGDAAKSKLLKRMASENDPMPPAEEKVRPSADEHAVLKQWIEANCPLPESAPQRAFLSPVDALQAMRADLEKATPRDRPFLRYFTLTHLHNAGQSAEEMQSYRHGLSKLVNSLSWGRQIVVPKIIDPEKTILRIDLRDYQWNEKTWDAITSRNPYGVAFTHDAARDLADATRCPLPYVRGDWFVAAASRPPLYHDILQLPGSERELEKLLRVDVAENVRQERVARAGFNSSGVSRNNRLIERHESGATVYWKSYDFAGNTGRQNLFALPLGPGDDNASFQHDGGEIIFTLPNGLQAYFLTDGKGTRIDKGPTAIVSDPRRPDRAVENGLSCMSCHARGMIEKADQVRPHVLKNEAAFGRGTVESVTALYPTNDKLLELLRGDAKRFQSAVAKTGAPLSATEPIAALASRFESEMDLPLVAAEAGVPTAQLLRALEKFPHLAKPLGTLRVEGTTIQRQVFVDSFQDMVEALQLGRYLASRNVAADRLVRQGLTLLPTDRAAALKAFDEAARLEPENPQAHAGRGDVLRVEQRDGDAILAYTEAIRLDPRTPVYFNNRALVYQKQGEADRAIADFAAALRLDPRFGVAYHNRGVAHYHKGELDRAIADYTEAISLDPTFARAFNNRGYARLDKTDYDQAIADFTQAVKLDPRLAAAFNNRGLAHLKKRQPVQAIADFTEAIRLDSRFARAYFNRSVANRQQGLTARADADLRRARELDPNLDDE